MTHFAVDRGLIGQITPRTITLLDLQQDLQRFLGEVTRHTDHPLRIKLPDGTAVVVMSERDYCSTRETLHLLSSPRNAARLSQSIQDKKAGRVVEVSLRELTDRQVSNSRT